ncbi:MAG: shikimate kinase [Candidatus Omnitrophica bacterium]|nr:shikimate kinase [Candidatus Omnitrophota bacterium]
MASGKTVVSNRLGELLKREVVSIDSIIEKKERKEILEIFDEFGEAYFRKAEKEVIREVSQKENIIIDCGGGVVLDKENIDNLSQNGVIFLLSASPTLIYARIKGKKNRPVLNVKGPLERIKELMRFRQPLYAHADYKIKVDKKTVQQVCEEIMAKL